MKINNKAYTLVEIIVWVLIFSIVIVTWFYALTKINSWKIKLAQQTSVTKEAYFFSEKLFQEIKKWWTIDYEEYFNRKVVWTTTSSWYYNLPTWFWNYWKASTWYWNWFYYCRSLSTWKMLDPTWLINNWCYKSNAWIDNSSIANPWPIGATTGDKQRYWQYYFQFVDYNVDADTDWWDQDWNLDIRWDLDDEHLWIWPKAFSWSMLELYLIWDNWKSRTYFRRKVIADSNSPIQNCTSSWTETGCLGTLQILKLSWKDWGMDHNWWNWAYDWKIDTWIVDPTIYWTSNIMWTAIIAWSVDMNSYWQDMFPSALNVTDFKVDLFPDVYKVYWWKEMSSLKDINPYLKLSLSIKPGWLKRKWIIWDVPEIKYQTTINLVDYLD